MRGLPDQVNGPTKYRKLEGLGLVFRNNARRPVIKLPHHNPWISTLGQSMYIMCARLYLFCHIIFPQPLAEIRIQYLDQRLRSYIYDQ